MAVVGLAACAELPPLPQVGDGVDWTCSDGFVAAIDRCNAADCPGFMSMNSIVDNETVHYVSRSVYSVIKYGDTDSMETIELHSTTDHFRSAVTLGSVDLVTEPSNRTYRVLSQDLADAEDDAVSLRWEASNSQIPQVKIGVRGLANIAINDDWVRVIFLVNNSQDEILQGCAYIPVD
ncbi:MAG: hypothetical protein ACJAZO_002706 [Myxococcota bacterium]|jgi:hypothetical protein